MIRTVKIDWLCFSFPREFDALPLVISERAGYQIQKVGASRWHKEKWEVRSSIGERHFWVFLKPRTSAGKPMVEMTGSWFLDSQVEREALELMKLCSGVPNRLDVAWDYQQELVGEADFWAELRGVRPKRRQSLSNRTNEYGEWTGVTFGYGVGSEVCCRIYDKALETGTIEHHVGWWWRVEVTVRGNTLKAQELIQNLGDAYDLAFLFIRSRWRGWPEWTGFTGGEVPRPAPRPRGVATYEGAVLYHQRIIAKHQRALAEIEECWLGGVVCGSEVSSGGEVACDEGAEGGALCESCDSRG